MTVKGRSGRLEKIRRSLMPWIFLLMVTSLLANTVAGVLGIVQAVTDGLR